MFARCKGLRVAHQTTGRPGDGEHRGFSLSRGERFAADEGRVQRRAHPFRGPRPYPGTPDHVPKIAMRPTYYFCLTRTQGQRQSSRCKRFCIVFCEHPSPRCSQRRPSDRMKGRHGDPLYRSRLAELRKRDSASTGLGGSEYERPASRPVARWHPLLRCAIRGTMMRDLRLEAARGGYFCQLYEV